MQFQTIKVVCVKFYMAEISVIMGLMGQSEYVFCGGKIVYFQYLKKEKRLWLLCISANVGLLLRFPGNKHRC